MAARGEPVARSSWIVWAIDGPPRLVLVHGGDPQRLAHVLLVDPRDAAVADEGAVEPLHVQAGPAGDLHRLRPRGIETRGPRQTQSERLVGDDLRVVAVRGLQDAGAWRSVDRLAVLATRRADKDQLLLDATEAEAHASCPPIDAQRVRGQFVDQPSQLGLPEWSDLAFHRSGSLASGQNRHRACAVGPQGFEQGKAILLADLQ